MNVAYQGLTKASRFATIREMKRLYLDIETLPATPAFEPVVRELYEKIPDRSTTFDDYLRRTALSGNFGSILCIGYAIDDAPAEIFSGSEADQLGSFWEIAQSVDLFIGHNLLEFDLPFIVKRSMVHRLRPSLHLSFVRYRSNPIYDTKKEWDSWSNTPATSLDTLAKIFGYETSKQGIDGSQVYDFWKTGRLEEIYAYCQRDVELTRKIYKRLTFQEREADQ